MSKALLLRRKVGKALRLGLVYTPLYRAINAGEFQQLLKQNGLKSREDLKRNTPYSLNIRKSSLWIDTSHNQWNPVPYALESDRPGFLLETCLSKNFDQHATQKAKYYAKKDHLATVFLF